MNSKNKEVEILTHSDTDGICSGILLERILKEEKGENRIKIELPKKFGNYREIEEDYKEAEAWMTDMRPVDKDFEGTVIDHHQGHFRVRRYKLILDLELCTTELLFALYKQRMKTEDSWLVVLGAIGDFAVPFLERELKENWNKLLNPLKKGTSQFNFFLGGRMSALINSGCRINKAEETLNAVKNLKEPFSILKNRKLQEFRQIINRTVYSITNTNDIAELKRGIKFFEFASEYRIEGRIASQLAGENNSAIVYNSQLKRVSIRGELTSYIAARLAGSEVGGHSVAMGGDVIDEFVFRNSIFKNIGEK